MGTIEDIAVLQSQMASVLERLDLAEPVVAQNATDIAVLQADFSPVPGEILVLTTLVENSVADIEANATAAADNATAIASNDADIAGLNTRVTVNETKLDSIEPRLLQVETTETDHENRVTVNEGILADLQPRMDNAETNINAHETRIDVAESTIGQNVIDIDSNQTALIAAGTTIVNHGGQLNDLETRLTANEAVDAEQQIVIDQSASDIISIQENGITSQELIDEITVQLEALDLDVDALQAAQNITDYIQERFGFLSDSFEQTLNSDISSIKISKRPNHIDIYVDGVQLEETDFYLDRYELKFVQPIIAGKTLKIVFWGAE